MDERLREMLAGYVDGELSEAERHTFEEELQHNIELQAELEQFRKLKEVTGLVKYADLPDEVWETYWESLYKKLERGIGWIFFSLGAIVIICYGLYQLFSEMFIDPDTPTLIKIGVTTLLVGLVILVVSLTRESLFAYRRDRYKEVLK